MRSVRLLALAGVAATLAAAPSAGAAGTGAHTDLAGTAVMARTLDSNSSVSGPSLATFNGQCTYARYAAGVGGSGITFTLVGVGSSSGAYKGVPIVATGIKCTLYKPDMTIVASQSNLPGYVSETHRSQDSNDARGGQVCVEMFATLQYTPAGENDPYIESGPQCSS